MTRTTIDLLGHDALEGLLACGAIVAKPQSDLSTGRRWLVDVRDGTNLEARRILTAAVDRAATAAAADTVVGIVTAGAILAAQWAASHAEPFWTVRLEGPRTGGLRREVEPDTVRGRRVLLVDNHLASGRSLTDAASIVERRGGIVAGAFVVTARHRSVAPLPTTVLVDPASLDHLPTIGLDPIEETP